MTKNKLLLVSVLSSFTAVGVAAAQPGGGGHFQKLDTNGDGVVTTAELETGAIARWTASDTNKDGKVTADEMEAQFASHKQEFFKKQDVNGNGSLERSEAARMPEARFTALDTDKSGALSEAELAAGHATKKEKMLSKGKGLPGDSDGDGAITKAEALAGVQKMAKKLDADGDGKLTKDELARAHGPHGGPHGRRGHHQVGDAG